MVMLTKTKTWRIWVHDLMAIAATWNIRNIDMPDAPRCAAIDQIWNHSMGVWQNLPDILYIAFNK